MMTRAKAWILMMAFVACPLSRVSAQGMLPPSPDVSTCTPHGTSKPLLIGDRVPESLSLPDEAATHRSVLSYHSAIDILVITFFSEPCAATKDLWPKLRRLQEDYHEWHVAFLAISTEPGESPMQLPVILKQEKLPWPTLHDGQKIAANLFKMKATPETVIIDEFGVLRYRGPVSGVGQALDTLIGHSNELKDPEPLMTEGCAP
jgi:thiol-disulfide isomerase/thioredoxin